jgi:hypothetical protein
VPTKPGREALVRDTDAALALIIKFIVITEGSKTTTIVVIIFIAIAIIIIAIFIKEILEAKWAV